jgi:chromosome segregation ATPase
MKDLRIHREQLDNEIVGLIEDRNDLQNKMSEINQEENSRGLLQEIDEWQKTTIKKVDQVAEQARQQVIKLLNSQRTNMMNEFEILSRELIQLKESKEYLEQNIESLRKTMQRLNQDLRLLKEQNAIELNMEQSNRIAWDRMIYVKGKATHTTNQQRQQTSSVTDPKFWRSPTSPVERCRISCGDTTFLYGRRGHLPLGMYHLL